MPYNLLMPEEEQQSRPPWWVVLWQVRWWIVLATLFILVWWLVPPWLYLHTGTPKADKLKAITDTRTALLAGLIGVGALLTFWLNSRVYRITARTLEVTEQGHITERYTKAIEQLGNNELTIRPGGIYALERIAKDSNRDHPTVVEVLSAFVRERSDPAHTNSKPSDSTLFNPSDAEQPNERPKPASDVRAALTVLARLPLLPDVPRADLSNVHLVDTNLRMLNLSGFRLQGASLQQADLSWANLEGANLVRANLRDAHLKWTALQEAYLQVADLRGADLEGAHLEEAHLEEDNLRDAHLESVHLERADLRGADLRGADLQEAHLKGANLAGTYVNGQTVWPPNFDWRAAGVSMLSNEPTG
jgi:uncharacterized protein YjbI with pentapeptide repeats